MPFLLTDSPEPLAMNTLPALKLTHFSACPRRGEIYAYARFYVCRGAIRFCVTGFDETPPESARMAFVFAYPENEVRCVRTVLFKYGETVAESSAGQRAVDTILSTGADEQGWYWQREGELDAEFLRKALGRAPKSGDVLVGNVVSYDETETAFGSAFPVPFGEDAFSPDGFDVFPVVSY